MVNDVESILNEIRERVRADHDPGGVPVTAGQSEPVQASLAHANAENGNSESLIRMSAHLTTTSRAWDRLPPMYSNRKGGTARLELWIKARLKSLSRWFTWEQVNFNSAVHHALAETLHALAAHQQELARIRAELLKENENSREKLALNQRELTALRAGIETLTAEIRKRDADLEARASESAAALRKEIDTKLDGVSSELRESDQLLREEQRVCFKQLSLEASEASVSADRGRRVIESRLDDLETSASNREK
jgi:flagellar biosynthesis GTPase FlhF